MATWFLDQTNGAKCPSDSVIRKKLSPLWNELRREAQEYLRKAANY